MNKIGKKLFGYFFLVMIFFSVVVFTGYYGILKYQLIGHHEEELVDKTEIITRQLEEFCCTDGQVGKGAYLKYLDDITLAEVYVIRKDGEPFTCGKNPDSEKQASAKVKMYANQVFSTEKSILERVKNENGKSILYVAEPVFEEGELISALVMVDTFKMEWDNFVVPMLVLLFCLLLAITVSIFLIVFLVKRFMKPIHRIGFVTKELANGNYQAKVGIYDNNEIGILAKETDILAEKLDVAQRKSERMNKMQKDYITNLSHELRTPVAVIRSSLEAIKDGMVAPEEVLDYQNQILTETVSLQRLINDMLELSRLENEDFPIEKDTMNLYEALEDSIRSVRLLANDHNIEIEYSRKGEEWLIDGDYGRIRQMFIIVLENAVKYSKNDTKIQIEVYEKERECFVSVQDEGCGISKEDQEMIFEKFYRTSDMKKTGTGLGLVIMKNIAKRHDIDFRLTSEVGKGTKILFIIPCYI